MSETISCPLCGKDFDPTVGNQPKCPNCGNVAGADLNAPGQTQQQASLLGVMPTGKSRIGDYFLECHIGSGGMGEVFLARQISMKREVALKILQKSISSDTKYLERFFREVRLLAQIEHPNVVRAIEAGMEGDTCYFSMEYAPGLDLKKHIDSGKRFDEANALRIAKEAASALKYAWDKHKLIHRDVKPANMILTPDGEVKLMDLGISKIQSESSDITVDGMMVGSPTYISPEQARAEQDIDCRADMYSLGASLFHMLAGSPPFEAETPMAVILLHLSAPVPDVRQKRLEVSQRTAKIIMKMMAKDKAERFASWNDAIEAIEEVLDAIASNDPTSSAIPLGSQLPKTIPYAEAPKLSELGEPPSESRVKKGNRIEAAMSRLPVIGFLTKRISWHRTLALLILLVLILMAFASVVNRSVKDARLVSQQRRLLDLISLADMASSDRRPFVIRDLEELAKDAPPSISAPALECIEKIRRKGIDELEAAKVERRDGELETLKRKSYELEALGDFRGAIKVWKAYRAMGEFRDDPKLAAETKDAISYLERKRKSKEAGIDE